MLTKIKNIFGKKENMNTDEIVNDKHSPEIIEEKISENLPGDIAKENILPKESKTDEKIKDELSERQPYTPEEIKEEVIKVLKTCYDPEIPVDVWELGLIYDIKIATNGDVLVVMTLTSPSCPVAGILPGEIEQKIKEHPMINDCKVQLTFDPPWSQKNMSEVAKLELGFL